MEKGEMNVAGTALVGKTSLKVPSYFQNFLPGFK